MPNIKELEEPEISQDLGCYDESISMELLRRIIAAWDQSTATERLADVINEASQYITEYDEVDLEMFESIPGDIIVEVRGGVAYCDDPRVQIIDYDNQEQL